jgi:hypothetical protein
MATDAGALLSSAQSAGEGEDSGSRRAYHAPLLRRHGTLEERTHGGDSAIYDPGDSPEPYAESAGVS